MEQDNKKKQKKIIEEPKTDQATDIVIDQADKNYEIYGDEEEIENVIEEQSEETVSITPKAPYYTLPDFDWENKSLWINDRHAIKYWMRTYNGNQNELDKIKNEQDFTQKSY